MYVLLALLILCTVAAAAGALKAQRRGKLLLERLNATETNLLTQTDEYGRIQALLGDTEAARRDLSAKRQTLEASLQRTEVDLNGALDAKRQTSKAARQLELNLRAEQRRILDDLEATQKVLDALKESERNAVAERDRACTRSLEAQRAQRAAEEEARQSRTSKESYAIEVKLLREELKRAELELEKALKAAQEPPDAVVDEQEAPVTVTTVRVTTWWCQACNTGGTKPKKCCSDAPKANQPAASQNPSR